MRQWLDRSNSRTQKISTRVTAATVNRVAQVMPRLTHHNSAQLIKTGTIISSCNGPRFQRDAPTPTPKLPPILMQVDEPSILTKPAPYSAHGFEAAFGGRSGSDLAGLSGLLSRNCCAGAADADSIVTMMAETITRIRGFYRGGRGFATGRI